MYKYNDIRYWVILHLLNLGMVKTYINQNLPIVREIIKEHQIITTKNSCKYRLFLNLLVLKARQSIAVFVIISKKLVNLNLHAKTLNQSYI